MKSSVLSLTALVSIIIGVFSHSMVSSHIIFARSLLSDYAEDLDQDISNILRRSDAPLPPPRESKKFSPSVLRAQDAAAAVEHKSANSVKLKSTSTPSGAHSGPVRSSSSSQSRSSPRSPPISPPVSPRTAGSRADKAERVATYARDKFVAVGRVNQRRLDAYNHIPTATSYQRDFIDKMNMFDKWKEVAEAKRGQASAYSKAADAAHKAGRHERYVRNSQKAASSKVHAQFHDASIEVSKWGARREFRENEHKAMLANNPNPRGGETSLPTHQYLQETESALQESLRIKERLFREAKHLRIHEGGLDTDSEYEAGG